MRLLIFLLIAYVLLPFATIFAYRFELLGIYPIEMANEISNMSSAGIILFYLFMTQILLGARVKFLEKGVGLPVLVRVHGMSTLGTLIFLAVHRNTYITASSFSSFTGYLAAMITIFVIFFTLFIWLNTPLGSIPIIKQIRSFLHKRMQYQHFRAVHNLMALAALVVGIHINSSSLAEDSIITIYIMRAYFVFTFGYYLYHKFIKPIALRKRMWEVVDTIHETENTDSTSSIVTICLKQMSGTSFKYTAGQFGFFRFISGALNKRGEEHPFSFSSSPHEHILKITVQDEGDFTHRLQTECSIGDTLTIDGPYGTFCLEAAQRTRKKSSMSIIGIAGGIGITPYMGWLQSVKHNPHVISSLSLLWMRREQEDELAKKVLAYNDTDNITVEMFSRSKEKVLDIHTVQAIMQDDSIFYICASLEVTRRITRMLKKLGVHKSRIHSELFTMG